MNNNVQPFNGGDVRAFVQERGISPANPYVYYGALSLSGLTQSIADPDPIYHPSTVKRNAWDIVDTTPKAPALGSTDFTQLADRYLRDGWRSIIRRNCPVNVQAVIGKCTRPDDMTQWDAKLVIRQARVTGDFGYDGAFNPLGGDDNASLNITGSLTYPEIVEIMRLRFSKHADATILAEVLDGLYSDSGSCADCAEEGEYSYYLTLANGGSPGLSSQIVYSVDGDETYAAMDIPTLGGLSGTRLAVVGNYLVVISQAANSHHFAALSDVNDGVVSWTKVLSGYVAAKGPRAIWSKSPAQTYVAGAGGYIYLMSDVTGAVTPVSAGDQTTQDLNDIHGNGRVLVAVGNSNAVVLSTNDGESFSLVTGPAVGIALNAVWVIDDDTWVVGTANGRVFFTTNQGKTWTEKVISSAFTAINDIVFVDDTIGYLVAQKGGTAAVYSTTDGGYSWQSDKPRLDSLPAAERYNFAAVAGPNKVAVGGRVASAGDGVLAVAE